VPPGATFALDPSRVSGAPAGAIPEVTSLQRVPALHARYELYYCRLCPSGTLTATLPSAVAGARRGVAGLMQRNALRFGILLFFLVLMVLVSRAFCRTFCPLGAIYGIINPFALWRVVVRKDACTACKDCNQSCPVDLDVAREAGGAECLACGDCIRTCTSGAISRRFGP